MLITNSEQLKKYAPALRIWQGIPSIEVTPRGRVFLTFYSGGTKEELGNYVLLCRSDDQRSFSDPIAVAFEEGHRCYDPCLWIDPLGRLWLTWAVAPDHAAYAAVCDDPDADELAWSEPFVIGKDVMMNKPTVLSTGEWLFPIAVWREGVETGIKGSSTDTDRKSFVYKSVDNGQSFERIGGADVPKRSFDEHMVLELGDGTLALYVRTFYGIGVSYSYDSGKTWTAGENSGLGGPCSRFFIRRLKSGRVLLVNHFNNKGRSHLTAMLSEDDGRTFPHKLLLDERSNVSYPDGVEAADGYLYVTYDRERGAFLSSLDQVYASAREILFAKITEADILAGKLVSPESRLKVVASKLGSYAAEEENPFRETKRFSDEELAAYLLDREPDEIVSQLFESCSVNCINLHRIGEDLDLLIDTLRNDPNEKKKTVLQIVKLLRSVSDEGGEKAAVIADVKNAIRAHLSEEISIDEIAHTVGISKYYMCHLFKSQTGLTLVEYRNALRLSEAKKLLIGSDKRIGEICFECGFSSESYFAKLFRDSEHVSPTQYRELLKHESKEKAYENENH